MAMTALQILEITVKGKALGQDILNTVHYRSVDPLTFDPLGVEISAYLPEFVVAWRLACLPGVSSNYTVESYNARTLVSTSVNPTPPPPNQLDQGDQAVIAGVPAIDVGALGGTASPTFVAVGVRKFTDRAGRSFRGGLRIGPITELQTDNNQLEPTQLLSYATRWTDFIGTNLTDGPGSDVEPCVFSKTLALSRPVPNTTLRTDTAHWVAALINSFVTSQVSRKQSAFSTT